MTAAEVDRAAEELCEVWKLAREGAHACWERIAPGVKEAWRAVARRMFEERERALVAGIEEGRAQARRLHVADLAEQAALEHDR